MATKILSVKYFSLLRCHLGNGSCGHGRKKTENTENKEKAGNWEMAENGEGPLKTGEPNEASL
jgi:hypothetical protein